MAQEKYEGHKITFSGSNGYPTIYVNGETVLLHRYVWEKVNGKIPEGSQIHHRDGDRLNWNIDNLEMLTNGEHHRRHALENGFGKGNKGKRKDHSSGFCGARRPVIATNENTTLYFESISDASKTLDVTTSSISRILRGVRKTAKGWAFQNGT